MSEHGKLAIEGGTPVRAARLPYGRQLIEADDLTAVTDALQADLLTTGPRVAEFEDAFSKVVGAKHAIAVTNGTAALHATAFAAGIEAGTDAITTPLTFAATANCVRYQQGRVIFADVIADSMLLDPAAVEAAWTPNTRAVLTVDYTGLPSELDELQKLCRDRGALLIEDACHALGSTYRNRRVGQIADMTVFSLHPVKHITSGEGGVITTDDDRLAGLLRAFRTHGISSTPQRREAEGSWLYEMNSLGYNYRITDFQCALATSQLKKLPGWVERRQAIAKTYLSAFADMPEIELPVTLADRKSAWHLFVIRLNLDRLTVGRREVFAALTAENLGVNVHYIPVHYHPYYQSLGYKKGIAPRAEDAYDRMITLPLFHGMDDADAADVVTAVRKVVNRYRR